MVLRLWVPLSHWLRARNWNRAASGAALTASRVAKRVAVSTPLRADTFAVVVISVLLLMCAGASAPAASDTGGYAASAHRRRPPATYADRRAGATPDPASSLPRSDVDHNDVVAVAERMHGSFVRRARVGGIRRHYRDRASATDIGVAHDRVPVAVAGDGG